MLYIYAKFREIILNGIIVMERTRITNYRRTDGRTDGWTDTKNVGGYIIIPRHFFLAGHKKDNRGCHFRSEEEVVTAVEEWVNGKGPNHFSSRQIALEKRWSKCITFESNYIEKKRWRSTENKLGWLLINSPL